MIFNSQGGGAAEVEAWINGGVYQQGETDITFPGRSYILGDITLKGIQTESKAVTPTAADQIITPTAGKMLSQVTVAGDADLIPENIAEGVNIFGVTGTHIEGITGIDYGEVTLSAAAQTVTVNHNLGVVPSFVALIPVTYAYQSATSYFNINGYVGYYYSSTRTTITAAENTLTSTQITFNAYSSSYKFKATTYKWVAIA